ncbi:MAG: BatA domain-containing protein [Candidatus Neomarinimicrobiota bacterium]|nr:BatA domain-containing protein [Candidatus Neomarinimicrobiota bacterium]
MSFLAPSILWGLFAAMIPIFIHLISTRRTQRIDFSTIRFIKELEHETIRKLKLRQLLLLLLRTVAIVLLVFVFARPVRVGYFPLAGTVGQSTRIAVILDNSATMDGRVKGTTLLETSRVLALSLLNDLETDFILDVYQTSPFHRLASEKINSKQRLREIFESIQPTSGPDNLWTAIDSAVARSEREEEMSGPSANRELYIFSDFPLTVPQGWKMTSENDWRVYLLLQPTLVNNLRVKSAGISSLLKMPNQLLTIETIISSLGDDIKKNVPVQLFFDETRMGQVVSDFDPVDDKSFLFQAFAGEPGIVHGTIEIPEDDFPHDDTRYFQFRMSEKIRCVLLHHADADGSLLTLALRALNEATQVVEVDEQVFGTVGATLLGGNDVALLLNPSELTLRESEAFEEFLTDGGAAVIFLGDMAAGQSHGWLKDVGIGTFTGMNRLEGENFFTMEKIAMNHPLFSEFPAADLEQEMPQVFAHATVSDLERADELLSLSNGEPFLVEKEIGSGRVLLFTAPPDLSWTDLPVRGIFVPLLHRMLIYLTAEMSDDLEVVVGESLVIPIPREHLSKEIVVISPEGLETKVIPDYVREQILIQQIESVGVHTVSLGGEPFTSFVANLDASEDPYRRMSTNQLADLFSAESARIVTGAENPVTAVKEARRGTELWHLFLICAFVILGAETWVGRIKET